MGLTLAIDDFGTGYSNFNYLRQFQVSKLKIDRSFIRDIAVNPDDAAITTAIISMAKSLNLKVVAEGVENEGQMSFLRAHQCDEIQGYYFSKPLAADKVADKLLGDQQEAIARAQTGGGPSEQRRGQNEGAPGSISESRDARSNSPSPEVCSISSYSSMQSSRMAPPSSYPISKP